LDDAHLNLPDTKVEEGHALSDLDNGFRSDTSHGGTKTSVQLEDGKLVEDGGVDRV
jgi:hypothetical protein